MATISDRDTDHAPAEPVSPNVVRVLEHVRTTHGADGATVLDILRGQMFRLNFVGSRVLELLKQGLAEREIVEQLEREFAIEHAAAAADVRDFVETLEKHHLLTVRDGNFRS